MSCLRMVALALACCLLAGCQDFWRSSGAWDVGPHRGLLLDISNYYHRHASEEGGRCKSPYFDGIIQAEVVDEADDSVDVHVHYGYRDFLNDGDDDCDPKFRPLRCTIMRECRGFAVREFTAAKSETGYDIIDMSGERRR
ncbi:MAG: hypothetical protein R3F54_08875 [Alphaproteobacteria bacterium]